MFDAASDFDHNTQVIGIRDNHARAHARLSEGKRERRVQKSEKCLLQADLDDEQRISPNGGSFNDNR